VRELPPPLPPSERTLGQFIAETIRAYGARFWAAIPLGLPIVAADQLSAHHGGSGQALVYWALTPLFVAAYVRACVLLHGRGPLLVPVLLATLVWLPFPVLRAAFIIPGLAWFAFVGLAVPAALVERLRFRDALVRGRELGVADYAHALGGLCALVFVVGLSEAVLGAILHSQADTSQRAALAVSDFVLGPLLFLGGALLYVDQAARVGSRRPTRRSRRDADLHPAVDPDAAGRADPQVEP
jgi:hypothetical protein